MELLIVGGGLAAQRCIEVLRAAGDDRPVTVVSDEPELPYDRPPLSKEAPLGDVDPSFRPAAWYRDHAVELRLGEPARALDPLRRTVTLEGGERLPARRSPTVRPAGGARAAHHPRDPKEGRMSLIARIEDDVRLAHGDCEAVTPEAFRVDDIARLVGETTDERLRAAARACPAGAIVLYDADTGEEVDA